MKSLSFFKGLSWLFLLNLMVKPVWIFFIDRQVQNITGNETYGQYFAVLNLSFVLLFLADAGLSSMVNQQLAYGSFVPVRKLSAIKLLLLLLYATSCFLAGWLTRIEQWGFLAYVVLIQCLNSLFVFLRAIITAHQFYTTDALLSVLDKTLMTLLCGSIIYSAFSGKMTLLVFLQIQAFCTAVAVSVALLFLTRKKLTSPNNHLLPAKALRQVWPFALIILLMGTHNRLDGFLLERMHPNGAFQAGIYAAAYRLLDACNMLGYLAAGFLLPFVARHHANRDLVREAILPTRHFLIFTGISIVSFTLIFAPWLQQLLYHSAEPYHVLVMQLCLAVLPAYYLVHIYGSLLTATSRFGTFISILSVSVTMNLVLNLFLIPFYGAAGCCMAALGSQYFCGIACCLAASKQEAIPLANRWNLAYLLFFAGLLAFFYSAQAAIHNVWIILVTTVLISLAFLVTRFRRIKEYFISLR